MRSVSSRSVWWLAGSIASGLVLPSFISALFAVIGHYPMGSALPPFSFLSAIGAMLAIIAAAALILIGASLHSLVVWNWRPFALSLLLVAAMSLGFVPGFMTYRYVKLLGYDLLGRRTVLLTSAIHEFERKRGAPPLALTELVPDFLPDVPKTGMAAYPEYEYAPEPGPCSNENRWHVKVDAGEVYKWDFFFYCPKKDYGEEGWGGYNEMRGDWAYLHE